MLSGIPPGAFRAVHTFDVGVTNYKTQTGLTYLLLKLLLFDSSILDCPMWFICGEVVSAFFNRRPGKSVWFRARTH